MTGLGRGIGAAADWAVRHRPRLPAAETGWEHPPWVGRALTGCLPLLGLLTAAALLHLVDRDWAWPVAALAYGTYLVLFHLLPWLVDIARSFAAGYRDSR